MPISERLSEYIAACFTGPWVQSHEHDDALLEIAELCRQENWKLATWDIDQGLNIPSQHTEGDGDAGGNDPLAAIRSINLASSQAAPNRTPRTACRVGGLAGHTGFRGAIEEVHRSG